MCGRFSLTQEPIALIEGLNLFDAREQSLIPRYNIAPTQQVAAVVEVEKGDRRLGHMRWGLIPFWADDPKIGNRMINARSETAAEKPAFRRSFRKRRCLVLADGFYEWHKLADRDTKQPYRVMVGDEEVFALAGLWDRWEDEEGEEIYSCTILTMDSNELVGPIHDRMPVILGREAMERWLDPEREDPEELQSLLTAYPSEKMEAYKISTRVNSPRNDDPEVVEPLEEGVN